MIQTFGKIYIVKIAKKFSFAKNVRGEFHQSSYFFRNSDISFCDDDDDITSLL